MRVALIFLALLSLSLPPTHAIDRATVYIKVILAKDPYGHKFGRSIDAIAQSTERCLLPVIRQSGFDFLDFKIATGDDYPRLEIQIECLDQPDSSGRCEILFKIRLLESPVEAFNSVNWPLSDRRQFGKNCTFLDPGDLPGLLTRKFQEQINRSSQDLQDQYFRKVVIARDAEPVTDSKGKWWVLPFSPEKLRITTNSLFYVETKKKNLNLEFTCPTRAEPVNHSDGFWTLVEPEESRCQKLHPESREEVEWVKVRVYSPVPRDAPVNPDMPRQGDDSKCHH